MGIQEIAIVVNGVFCVSFTTEDGREYIKYFLSENDVLLGSIEFNQVSRTSIQALEKALIYKASYKAFLELTNKHKVLDELKMQQLFKYWNMKESRLINLLSYDAGKNYEIFKTLFADLKERIPQYYIAQYLGVSAAQLSRFRKENNL